MTTCLDSCKNAALSGAHSEMGVAIASTWGIFLLYAVPVGYVLRFAGVLYVSIGQGREP